MEKKNKVTGSVRTGARPGKGTNKSGSTSGMVNLYSVIRRCSGDSVDIHLILSKLEFQLTLDNIVSEPMEYLGFTCVYEHSSPDLFLFKQRKDKYESYVFSYSFFLLCQDHTLYCRPKRIWREWFNSFLDFENTEALKRIREHEQE